VRRTKSKHTYHALHSVKSKHTYHEYTTLCEIKTYISWIHYTLWNQNIHIMNTLHSVKDFLWIKDKNKKPVYKIGRDIFGVFSSTFSVRHTRNDSSKPLPCCLVTFLSVSAIKLDNPTATLWCRNLIFLTTSVPYHTSWITRTLVLLYNRHELRIVKTSRAENTTWAIESVSLCTDVMR